MYTNINFRRHIRNRQAVCLAIIAGSCLILALGIRHLDASRAEAASPALLQTQEITADLHNTTSVASTLYLPVLLNNYYPWVNPFGVEVYSTFTGTLVDRTTELKVSWVRLNGRVSWRALQPNEGGAIRWNQLVDFENELRELKAIGATPIVVVGDYPDWATSWVDGITPSHCGPLLANKFGKFADFVKALVTRYSVPEFNVHVWELGNEPDIDPRYFPDGNSAYGCWGSALDPFYGGRHYGNMVKVVGAAIKQADPEAQVWIGGLLLDRSDSVLYPPNCPWSYCGTPELFLKGVLEAGAAPYFDVVPYHVYIGYRNSDQMIDHDNGYTDSSWYSWGGLVLGKARFIRQTLDAYGVQKPVFINEIGLTCPENSTFCQTPGDAFYQMQADFIVRSLVRGLSEDILGFTWYTLDGPGWRYGSLLYDHANTKPVYDAYQQLASWYYVSRPVQVVDYGADFEAYSFSKTNKLIHVVWAKTDQLTLTVGISQSLFLEAYTRDGVPITPSLVDGSYQIPVGFEPVYIIRRP